MKFALSFLKISENFFPKWSKFFQTSSKVTHIFQITFFTIFIECLQIFLSVMHGSISKLKKKIYICFNYENKNQCSCFPTTVGPRLSRRRKKKRRKNALLIGVVALCMLYVRSRQFNVSELYFMWNMWKFEPANVLLNSLLQFLCVLFQVALWIFLRGSTIIVP